METNTYFQIIDDIKYDTGQATLLAEGESTSEWFYDKEYEYKYKFYKQLTSQELISYKSSITTIKYYLYKGINDNYFMYFVNYKETRFTNLKKKINNILFEKKFHSQSIQGIKKETAIDYYFYGLPSFLSTKIQLKPLVSEQEAFGEIPIA